MRTSLQFLISESEAGLFVTLNPTTVLVLERTELKGSQSLFRFWSSEGPQSTRLAPWFNSRFSASVGSAHLATQLNDSFQQLVSEYHIAGGKAICEESMKDHGDQRDLEDLEHQIQDLARRDQRWRTWTNIPVIAFALGAPLFVSTIAVFFNLGSNTLLSQDGRTRDNDRMFGSDIDILVHEVSKLMSFGVAVCMAASVAIFVMAFRHGAIRGQLRRSEVKHARLISAKSD